MKENEPEQLPLQLPSHDANKTKSAENRENPEKQALEWVCHPAKKNKYVTALVTLFIVLLVVIVYYMTYSPWFAVLGFIILYASLSPFYFPTRYRLTDEEISIKTTFQTQHKKWLQYRSCYPDKNGILLSPFMRPTRLENFRGLYIRFWNNRDEVTAFVKDRLEKTKKDDAGSG